MYLQQKTTAEYNNWTEPNSLLFIPLQTKLWSFEIGQKASSIYHPYGRI